MTKCKCPKCGHEWEQEDSLTNAAATLGRIKSDRKTAAARENGKRGGRPKRKEEREEGK